MMRSEAALCKEAVRYAVLRLVFEAVAYGRVDELYNALEPLIGPKWARKVVKAVRKYDNPFEAMDAADKVLKMRNISREVV